ncbi:hypothetical protein DL766_009902 [Monosporascus sp. MC13-8B]|uniref:Uncharacterized protein n=1 Tax=Monosporascus cannonballus TaxID=155416 RepID=A0ABY0HF18_9PEZI|nr:hypothetical protein DL763_009548 [Monosporascus cannonballus]RYO91122.1 hypothetical protein DL762_002418 [Monosporascus cannonballus]RYP12936.1 hypothetical protein DL766_009902 [Monosporascus sp. MC13-8B]
MYALPHSNSAFPSNRPQPPRKKTGIGFIKDKLDIFRAPKAPRYRQRSALHCGGSPPPPLPQHSVRSLERTQRIDFFQDDEVCEIDDDNIYPTDDEYDADDERLQPGLPKAFSRFSLRLRKLRRNATGRVQHESSRALGGDEMGFPGALPFSRETSSPRVSVTGEALDDLSTRSGSIRIAIQRLGSPSYDSRAAPNYGTSLDHAEQSVLSTHLAREFQGNVLHSSSKRPIFQPLPHDEACGAREKDSDIEESFNDDWSMVDIGFDHEGKDNLESCHEHPNKRRKVETTPTSTSSTAPSPHPRVHPLCAAKYGGFFDTPHAFAVATPQDPEDWVYDPESYNL